MAIRSPLAWFQPNPLYSWTALYLSISWIANWILWVRVTRCTFLYHYMGASIFSLLGLALIIHSWLQRPERWQRRAGIAAIAIIVAAFLFWLPLYLGLPISSAALQLRRWFPSWI
jgi:dolichyl-phosphate-mannose--protein O-mannosyl transferase